MISTVYTHGGTVTGFAGDAFTAVFPLTGKQRGTVYQNALAAAYAVLQSTAQAPSRATKFGEFDLQVLRQVLDNDPHLNQKLRAGAAPARRRGL